MILTKFLPGEKSSQSVNRFQLELSTISKTIFKDIKPKYCQTTGVLFQKIRKIPEGEVNRRFVAGGMDIPVKKWKLFSIHNIFGGITCLKGSKFEISLIITKDGD